MAHKGLASPHILSYAPRSGTAAGTARVMPLGEAEHDRDDQLAGLRSRAGVAADFLKALGHDGRLLLLCHLTTGSKSVTELEKLLEARQAVVSQQLARLRHEGLVSARRDGQAIFYSIRDPRVRAMIALLGQLFEKPGTDPD